MAYKNKEDQKAASRKFYLANIAVTKQRAVDFKRIAYRRNKKYIKDYLSTHPCVDCGESDIVVLDFDHVRGTKVDCVTAAPSQGWSIERIQKEIAKCEVRCANCHRRVTHKRRLSKAT